MQQLIGMVKPQSETVVLKQIALPEFLPKPGGFILNSLEVFCVCFVKPRNVIQNLTDYLLSYHVFEY